MDVNLPTDLAEFVDKQVRDGRYQQPSDVVSAALRQFRLIDRTGSSAAAASAIGLSQDADIEAVVLVVMMEATKSANQDLAAIMSEVKAMTAAKQELREVISKVIQDVVNNACQINGQPPLDLSKGMGSAAAYQQMPLPFPDPSSPGGVRVCPTSLYNGSLDSVGQLRVILEELRGRLDSMSELSEMTSLRLQMVMDRRSKLMETLSNIMKSSSDTQGTIVGNLK
jgi:Arc/MetJ-type ribon-helix-helix transcriptional regulator